MKNLIIDNIQIEMIQRREDGVVVESKTFSVIADPNFWKAIAGLMTLDDEIDPKNINADEIVIRVKDSTFKKL